MEKVIETKQLTKTFQMGDVAVQALRGMRCGESIYLLKAVNL